MTELAQWLRAEMDRQGLTQAQAAVYCGVGQATISEILRRRHIPRIETLLRLADYFGTSRAEVLRLAGHLHTADDLRGEADPEAEGDEPLVQALLEEFRQVPDEWKPVAIEQVALLRRLAGQPPVRFVGEDPSAGSGQVPSAGSGQVPSTEISTQEQGDAEDTSLEAASRAA